MIYYIVPIYLFLIYTLQVIYRDEKKFLFLLFPAIFFVLIIGMFRDVTVGTDTYMYSFVFRYPENIEIGYKILSNCIKWLGGNFSVFLSFFFFISFLFKFLSFKMTSANVVLSLLVYFGFWFLVYDINGIRQGLALGFVALSIAYLNKENTKIFYLMALFAIINHYSSIIFFPFALLVNNIRCSNKLFLITFFTVLFLSITQIAQPIITFISAFLGNDSHLISKANAYSNDKMYNANILYSFSTLVRIIILFVTFFALQKIKISDRLKNILLWAALLNISLYLIFSQFELIATRLSLYYRFSECIFFSFLPGVTKNNMLKFLIGILILTYVIMQISQTLSIKNNSLIPYKSIIFE